MADNVTFTAGADSTPPNATVAATDELSDGSHAGIAKLAISANGDRTLIPATAADGLLVEVSNAGAITFGGLTDAELRASPVDVDGSGVTQPVSNAGLTALNGAIAGTEVQADIVAALPAGNNNIGDVDVASVPAPLSTTGGGTEATALRVTIANNSTGLVSVDDNGGSLTVDGPLTDTELRATPVPVSGTITVNEPVSVDDNGGSLTVDNTVLSVVGGGTEATAQRVTIANDSTGVLSVDDNGGSLTVDGSVSLAAAIPAGTNNIGDVDVLSLPALPAGTNNIGDVDVLTLPGVAGTAAHASPTSGNPVYVAGRASTAVPTDVGADGDAAGIWLNRNGAPVATMAPHVGLTGSPWSLTSETAQYTTTQTSTVLVAGGASERLVVTKVQIQVGGTTAGTLQLYFGTGAYSRGTNLAIFDGEFAPSATLKPGVIMDGPFISAANGDDLMVTDSAAINPLTITVWYYVLT